MRKAKWVSSSAEQAGGCCLIDTAELERKAGTDEKVCEGEASSRVCRHRGFGEQPVRMETSLPETFAREHSIGKQVGNGHGE